MNQAESGLLFRGVFRLGYSYYEFTRPLDLWKGKIGGEVAALGAIMVVVSVGLPFRRDKSKKNSKQLITEGGLQWRELSSFARPDIRGWLSL
jgi:hypothetical protein